ncbi:Uncharacterized membrane protein YsdA, DUF1294 family [Evansella caseinilytica]|uniref:Uncharacterized membrane protein YsdA, DUF1294 family n=1 Tax=Evansella caseinilytica TaxID=1503961 RepID=A0A1H3TUV3_9BACI|nr:DUF1294 domain-containing protein [Evansella caseinilytica]SDZ54023.1 Uncharacterized membrane protein YsdA, DUF1294 family [Evansella caseinilytica]
MSDLINFHYLIYYYVMINAVGFFMMGFDKRRAVGGGRRIPERTLMLTGAFGAALGMLIAAKQFRHKTKKPLFTIGLPLLIIVHTILLLLISGNVNIPELLF